MPTGGYTTGEMDGEGNCVCVCGGGGGDGGIIKGAWVEPCR